MVYFKKIPNLWKISERIQNQRPSETENRGRKQERRLLISRETEGLIIHNSQCRTVIYRPSTARHKMLFEERLGGEERRLMHLVALPSYNRAKVFEPIV
jgi:hypothetical protein